MRSAPIALVLASVMFLAAAGCSASTGSDEALAVEATVRAYNTALVQAFVALDMNELNAVATEDQAATEYFLMAALGESRVVMHATPISIEFGEVTFPEEGKASVTTTETWDYEHVSLDTSETVRTETGVVYHLQYDLVLQDGRWLVDAVTSLDDAEGSTETTQ